MCKETVQEFFFGGTKNYSATIEWAMYELLHDPVATINKKSEVASVIRENKKLEDSGIDALPFLQASVEETLHLHAPPSLLVQQRLFMKPN